MKSLADANTPGLLVETLTSNGHDVYWAYRIPGSSDKELIEKAAREERVVITFDKDFGELGLLARPLSWRRSDPSTPAKHPGYGFDGDGSG